ncbi:carbonic anhydrase [Marinoscillum sp. MHG1-6]|uniref:carbonic anhydrase n=1 Tax=Marinoscillum sp. MHG1-6 TaxID=2959627 RepID=UPI002157A2F8|nr:carbonic anhydrase family protein [Marinoscillum sp. MHG1-6]
MRIVVIVTSLLFLSAIMIHHKVDSNLPKVENSVYWTYSGDQGPDHWSELNPEYSDCSGERQSPVDIDATHCINQQKELYFSYHPFYAELFNNGHTLMERIMEPKSMHFDGEEYSLVQFHFHTPSEHHINGREFPMEIHFVHKNVKGDFGVIGILIEEGASRNHFLDHFKNCIPSHASEVKRGGEMVSISEAFPAHTNNFYYYDGSLTTPPCSENVHWIIFEESITAQKDQIEAIHRVINDDNRPIQQLGSRMVYHSVSM